MKACGGLICIHSKSINLQEILKLFVKKSLLVYVIPSMFGGFYNNTSILISDSDIASLLKYVSIVFKEKRELVVGNGSIGSLEFGTIHRQITFHYADFSFGRNPEYVFWNVCFDRFFTILEIFGLFAKL